MTAALPCRINGGIRGRGGYHLTRSYFHEAFSPFLLSSIGQLQEFIDTYRMSNEQILRLSERICDTPMIVIKPNYTYALEELQADLVKSRYMGDNRFLVDKDRVKD